MKKTLRILSVMLLLAAVITWLVNGASRGWTKTSVVIKTLDPVTEIEGITYQKKFLPGVDFLGAAMVSAAFLIGTSFLFRNKTNQHKPKIKKPIMKLHSLIALSCIATAVYASPQTYDFKDPKGVNNAVFKLDAPLESINGSASGITGTVSFDPENPAATTGKIIVASDSLTVPNPMQKEHLHSINWLDTTKYPEITFEAKSLANVKTDGNVTTADVTGIFTLHGVTKEITAPIKLTFLQDKLSARVPNLKGDLLVIRANFVINREDFNIQKGQYQDKVSKTINLSLNIAGASAK
jgi:polyisoprenoid-binding protein YceI